MIKWKKLRKKIKLNKLKILATITSVIVVGFILMFKLGGLSSGVSQQEHNYIQSVSSGKSLFAEPLFITHKLPTYLLNKIDVSSIALYRLVSVFSLAVIVLAMWSLLKQWYSIRIATICSWMFVCSAWVLHTGRFAAYDVLYMSIIPLLWAILLSFRITQRNNALLIILLTVIYSLYIPGLIWLPLGIIIWKRKQLIHDLRGFSTKFRLLIASLFLCSITPLVYGIIKSPTLVLSVIGLPSSFPDLLQMRHNAYTLISALPWKLDNADPATWVNGTPVLDFFSLAMMILGIYSLRFNHTLGRNKVLVVYIAMAVIFIIIGGPVTLTAIIPFVYIHIASGIAFMLQQWFVVFPKNPVARAAGTILMTLAIAIVSYYHIYHYFVAWPQTPETNAAFSTINLLQ